ncbi:MAG: DUF4139 domain-containing protein [Caulobacteraceae bacterium]|nr:DUF4139 domain-containing protein [Caulobacteraceae bacterium]
MGGLGGVLALLRLLTVPAVAEVVSPSVESVAVTIYQDREVPDPAAAKWDGYGLAMISETRTVDLPAGQTRLTFVDVADGALPQTATLEGLPGRIVEQNFDFNVLTPATLIQHSVGRPVRLIRINRRSGERTVEDAVLRSGPAGVVLDVGGRTEALGCSGDLEGLVFPETPRELTGEPTLSTLVSLDRPGRYKLRLSYLAIGLAWRASYVAEVAPDASRLTLTGWITLANHGDTGFPAAHTSVVAGTLARRAVERVERALPERSDECWPMENSHSGVPPPSPAVPAPPALAEVVVTAQRRDEAVKLRELGDYKLYSIDEPTTVAARQTKQVLFLEQDDVKFDRVYVYRLNREASEGAHDEGPTVPTLRLRNTPETGLGRPLPTGAVSIRQRRGEHEFFLAEPEIRNIPVGEPFELAVGQASDVRVSWRLTGLQSVKRNGREGVRATVEATLSNAKGAPVLAELRLDPWQGDRVIAESRRHLMREGEIVWSAPVSPNGQVSITYTVERMTD